MKSEKKTNIELSHEEATQLVKLLNIAVRQIGLEDGGEIASAGLYFLQKLNVEFSKNQEAEQKVKSNGSASKKEKELIKEELEA